MPSKSSIKNTIVLKSNHSVVAFFITDKIELLLLY